MVALYILNYWLFLVLVPRIIRSNAECHMSIVGEQDKIYVWSDDKINANDAQQSCMGSGGNLLRRSATDKNRLITLMQQKYNKGLVTVDIYKNLQYMPDRRNRTFTTVTYKYRPSSQSVIPIKDSESISSFIRPPNGELRSIKLFKRFVRKSSLTRFSNHDYASVVIYVEGNVPPYGDALALLFCSHRALPRNSTVRTPPTTQHGTGDFNETVNFCYYFWRDAILPICAGGWKDNFKLYGGTPKTRDIIILGHFYNELSNSHSTKLLLPGESASDPFQKHELETGIPDNSVFVGARSDVNETSWYWSDGTKVTDADYPTSNANVCQQMSWPLTYDDGINLLPKRCDEDRAYFVCEIKFDVSLNPIAMQSSMLHLSWKTNIFGSLQNYPDMNVMVQPLHLNKQSSIVPFVDSQFVIYNLKKETTYDVQVTLQQVGGCSSFIVSTTATARTSSGSLDPVTSAAARNDNDNQCIIEWKYDFSDVNIISFKISTVNTNPQFTLIVKEEDLNNAGPTAQTNFDLNYLGFNKTFQFVIQAVSDNGESEATLALGDCTTQKEDDIPVQSTAELKVSEVVGIGVGCFISGACLILCRFCGKKKSNKKKQKKADSCQSHPISTVNQLKNEDNHGYEEVNFSGSANSNYASANVL